MKPLIARYSKKVPTLILGLLGYAAMGFVFLRVRPEQIRNVWLPNGYVPLFLLSFLADFFFCSFLFLNSRRGFFASLLLNLGLFSLIHQAPLWFFGAIATPLIVSELLFSLAERARNRSSRLDSQSKLL